VLRNKFPEHPKLTLNFNTNIDTLRFRLRKIEIEDTVSIFQYASDSGIDMRILAREACLRNVVFKRRGC